MIWTRFTDDDILYEDDLDEVTDNDILHGNNLDEVH